jgi:hypothetical protein
LPRRAVRQIAHAGESVARLRAPGQRLENDAAPVGAFRARPVVALEALERLQCFGRAAVVHERLRQRQLHTAVGVLLGARRDRGERLGRARVLAALQARQAQAVGPFERFRLARHGALERLDRRARAPGGQEQRAELALVVRRVDVPELAPARAEAPPVDAPGGQLRRAQRHQDGRAPEAEQRHLEDRTEEGHVAEQAQDEHGHDEEPRQAQHARSLSAAPVGWRVRGSPLQAHALGSAARCPPLV